MSAPERVVLVDGSAFIYRAYFALPNNLATAAGLHTNAILGFATMFRRLFAGRKPDLGAVVFDAPGRTFREERFADYKATRPTMPPELFEQLPWIDRLVTSHCFPSLRLPGWEADDVIATLCEEAVAAGMEVVIVSADKDLAQLVGPSVRMLDTLRNVTYDADLVQKKWGVVPSQIVDWLALRGDDSDNIPGVAGIGDKGAQTLLGKYGSLDGILAAVGELKGKQRAALEAGRESALLSRALATLDRHAPVGVSVRSLAIGVPDAAELNALYKELELYSLLSEEARDGAAREVTERPARVLATVDQARDFLARASAHETAIVSLYDPMGAPLWGSLVGLGLALDGNQRAYLPLLDGAGGGLGAAGLALARSFLEDARAKKLVHDAKALAVLCARHRIALAEPSLAGDTMLASFLVEPTKVIPHRLDQLAREYLQETLAPIKRLVGAGQAERPLSDLAATELAPWAEAHAAAVARLWPILAPRLDELGLRAQLFELDLPLAFVLARMELAGIRVDGDELRRIGVALRGELAAAEAEIHRLAGRAFNIGSTKQLADVLFEELKLPVLKRTKTGYSTDGEVLERLAAEHAIARHLVEHRKIAKLINTYTDVLERAQSPVDGRVHATFQQTVGATGRLISTEPDLQRTPVKTPEGKRIRRAFIPDGGARLICADWSQIELRVLAHVSSDARLGAAFREGRDVHRETASEIFHCALTDVTPAQRGVGKTINFATIYGQGATALGQILGIPRKEAQRYIDGYFATYAGVRAWLDRTVAEAHARGYVTTLFGRRRFIPELSSNNVLDRQAGERIAANTPIQGSAADLCKLAMLRIARRLDGERLATRMLLQVHDELVFESPTSEVERAVAIIRAEMEGVWPLQVPLVVDIGVGDSWAEAHR